MPRNRWLAAVVALVGLTGPVVGQTSPLTVVPAKAPIVVQLRGWDRVLGRLSATLKSAAPDYAPLIVGEIQNAIAEKLTGREIKSIAKEGPIFVILTEVPGGDDFPEFAVAVRVTNYAEFRDGFLKEDERKELKPMNGYEATKVDGKETFFLTKGDFAVIAPSQKALKLFQDPKTESLAGKLDKALESKFLESDLSVYVDMAAVNKKYGNEIASARQVMEQMLQQTEELGGMPWAAGFAKNLYAQLFQLAEDAECVVLALDVPPEGFSLKLHGQVGEKSKSNGLLKAAKLTRVASMNQLPAGAMIYSGGTVGRDWLRGAGMMFMLGAGGGGDDKENKAASDAVKELEALPSGEWYASMSLPANNITAVRYDDPAKAAALTLKMYQAFNKNVGGLPIKGTPEVQPDAQKHAGFTLHRVKFTFDFDKLVEKVPEEARDQMKEMMQKTLGTGQQSWFGSDGKVFVEISAKDWDAAKALLDQYATKPISGVAEFEATRKHLPEQAVMIGAIDTAKYAQIIFDAMSPALRAFGRENLKMNAAEGPPHFVGYALGMQPRNIAIDLWVPADGVKQVVKMLAPLLKGLDK